MKDRSIEREIVTLIINIIVAIGFRVPSISLRSTLMIEKRDSIVSVAVDIYDAMIS